MREVVPPFPTGEIYLMEKAFWRENIYLRRVSEMFQRLRSHFEASTSKKCKHRRS